MSDTANIIGAKLGEVYSLTHQANNAQVGTPSEEIAAGLREISLSARCGSGAHALEKIENLADRLLSLITIPPADAQESTPSEKNIDAAMWAYRARIAKAVDDTGRMTDADQRDAMRLALISIPPECDR